MIERIFLYPTTGRDNEYVIIGKATARAHQHCTEASKKDADQVIGRSPGALPTELQAICGILGNSVQLNFISAQDADITRTEPIMGHIDPNCLSCRQKYDMDRLAEHGMTLAAPPKRNRTTQRKTDFSP